MDNKSPDIGLAEAPKRMLAVTTLPDGRTQVSLNPSSLLLLQTCPRKAHYALDRHLVALGSKPALEFGTAIHAAMEIYYAAPREARALPPNFKENINLMCQGQSPVDESESLIYQATRGFIEAAESLADLPDGDKRSIPNGGWLLGEYFEIRRNDPYEIVVRDGKPLVETLYETVIYDKEIQISLFGTVDAIMENKSTGQVVICDHKTASQVGPNFYNRTKPNHQYTAYVQLAQKCLGLDTDNFMINCFQVKAKPKTARGTGPNFLHLITKRTPQDIEDFNKTVHYYVTQYLEWIKVGFFPYGPVDACGNYGKCNFLDICESPETIKENIIGANYKDVRV